MPLKKQNNPQTNDLQLRTSGAETAVLSSFDALAPYAHTPASAGRHEIKASNCRRSNLHGTSPYRNCLMVDKSGMR
jgi:hypothetical protein